MLGRRIESGIGIPGGALETDAALNQAIPAGHRSGENVNQDARGEAAPQQKLVKSTERGASPRVAGQPASPVPFEAQGRQKERPTPNVTMTPFWVISDTSGAPSTSAPGAWIRSTTYIRSSQAERKPHGRYDVVLRLLRGLRRAVQANSLYVDPIHHLRLEPELLG